MLCDLIYMWNLMKIEFMETENRLVVAEGGGGGNE